MSNNNPEIKIEVNQTELKDALETIKKIKHELIEVNKQLDKTCFTDSAIRRFIKKFIKKERVSK